MNKIGATKILLILLSLLLMTYVNGQTITKKCGKVPIEYSNYSILFFNNSCGTQYYAPIDSSGVFEVENMKIGTYTVLIDTIPYKKHKKIIHAKNVAIDTITDTLKIENIILGIVKF